MKITIFTGKGGIFKAFGGLSIIILGLIMLILDPLGYIVKKNLKISEGNFVETLWMTVPVEANNYIYVFNITNAEEFLRGEDKRIKFEEVGPYVFKEKRGNENITYNENGTMTYNPTLSTPFIKELSVGDLYNDTIVTFNIPLLGFLSLYSDASSFKKFGINLMIGSFNPSPFIKVSAHDYFWGYDDNMVKTLSTYMPNWIDFEKFGVLDRVYAYKKDVITVNLDETKGVPYSIEYWNGSPGLDHWGFESLNTSRQCSVVKGSYEGLIYPPDHTPKNNTYRVYKKIFCRPLDVVFSKADTDSTGLEEHHYSVPSSDLSCENPDNSCYCPDDKPHLPEGVADLAPCYYGLPLAISKPHFYQSDPKLLKPYAGLNPNEKDHESQIIIQPNIGLPLHMSVKAQLNLVMGDVKYNKFSRPFTDSVIPLLWIDSKMESLPAYLLLLIRLGFVYLPVVQIVLGWVFLVTGLTLFFYSTMALLKPTQEWLERRTSTEYPGRLPMINLLERRRNEEESTMFI